MAEVRVIHPTTGKPRPVFEMSAQSEAYNRVLSHHHAQEVYARECARKIVRQLRFTNSRGLAQQPEVVYGLCDVYKVSKDHYELVRQIVVETIDADYVPVIRKGKRQKRVQSPAKHVFRTLAGAIEY